MKKQDYKNAWGIFIILWVFGAIRFFGMVDGILPPVLQLVIPAAVLFGTYFYMIGKYNKAEK